MRLRAAAFLAGLSSATLPLSTHGTARAQGAPDRGALASRAMPGEHHAPSTATESTAVLRRARAAQAEFERTRRQQLPTIPGGSGGRCDVRVGRFCYWYDDGEDDGPPEPKRTGAAREKLLGRLADAAERLPGDRWIAGQRVRYFVEQGRHADAVAAARACAGEAWWCTALAGLAFHTAGDFGAADSTFAAALAAMPPATRCAWTDLSLLLEDEIAKRYERTACDGRTGTAGAPDTTGVAGPVTARTDLARRFWALARPLYLLPGNDLRTEIFARITMAEIQAGLPSVHGTTWGPDLREIVIRYGWPTRWSRDLPRPMSSDSPVLGHDPAPSYDFAPAARPLDDPAAADADDWALRDPLAQTRYAPAYAKAFVTLPHQAAFFRAGDSARVVVAFDVREDTLFRRDSLLAAAALITAPDSALVVRHAGPAARRAVLELTARWEGALLSVEIADTAARHVARSRHGVRPPGAGDSLGTHALSDVLLLDTADSLPATLDAAIPRARGSERVRRDERLGVYWELYGTRGDGAPVTYSLTVERESDSWLRRAAETIRLSDKPAPITMRWTDAVAGTAPLSPRALAVDLSPLRRGRYRLTLTAELPGEPVLRVERAIEVPD
jgi:hypothetical protein